MEIKRLQRDDLVEAMKLTERVFMEFDAPDYSPEGTKNFLEFIYIDNIYTLFDDGQLHCYGYYIQNQLVGIIATTGLNHICLLFVDREYHRQGIATKLFTEILKYRTNDQQITVHSSPYAIPVYSHWGFVASSEEQLVDGMRFTPMAYK